SNALFPFLQPSLFLSPGLGHRTLSGNLQHVILFFFDSCPIPDVEAQSPMLELDIGKPSSPSIQHRSHLGHSDIDTILQNPPPPSVTDEHQVFLQRPKLNEVIDAADEKIHGLDVKVLCKEDDSNTTQVGGKWISKINEISGCEYALFHLLELVLDGT
ncbi:hypothetical protein MC885_021745, partial [Smutsia gigantea]